MTRAWMHTLTGRDIVISAPSQKSIDPLTDLPEMLARITRFNGAVPAGVYSVAQHCALMADWLLDETGDAELAAIALLHDAHEYVIGDITTPQAEALAEIEAEIFCDSRLKAVIDEAKRRLDKAIHAACGVPWPPAPDHVRAVKACDLRMLATERAHMLSPSARRWAAVVENAAPLKMRGRISPWPVARAAQEYRSRLIALCPAVRRLAEGG